MSTHPFGLGISTVLVQPAGPTAGWTSAPGPALSFSAHPTISDRTATPGRILFVPLPRRFSHQTRVHLLSARCRFSTVVAAPDMSHTHLPQIALFIDFTYFSRAATVENRYSPRSVISLAFRCGFHIRTAKHGGIRSADSPAPHHHARSRPGTGRSRPSIHHVRGRDWDSPGPARPTRRGPDRRRSSAMSSTQAIYCRPLVDARCATRRAARPQPASCAPCRHHLAHPPVHPEPTSPPSPIPQTPHGRQAVRQCRRLGTGNHKPSSSTSTPPPITRTPQRRHSKTGERQGSQHSKRRERRRGQAPAPHIQPRHGPERGHHDRRRVQRYAEHTGDLLQGLPAASARGGIHRLAARQAQGCCRSRHRPTQRPLAKRATAGFPGQLTDRRRVAGASLPLRAGALPSPLPSLEEPLHPVARAAQEHRHDPDLGHPDRQAAMGGLHDPHGLQPRRPPRAAGHDAP